MASCEMCGSKTKVRKAKVEGAIIDACEDCAKFGTPINRPNTAHKKPFYKRIMRKEVREVIVPNFANIIRKSREKLGLKQNEFAKKLTEKESIIQKMESGTFTPSIKTARKLEKILKIKLIEIDDEKEETPSATKKEKNSGFTMADFIKNKLKKK